LLSSRREVCVIAESRRVNVQPNTQILGEKLRRLRSRWNPAARGKSAGDRQKQAARSGQILRFQSMIGSD